jgi:MFS family permease
MGAFALSNNYYLSLALLFFAGIVNLAFFSSAQAIVQIKAPAHLRGRLVGLFGMSALGLRALSGVTVGLLGSVIGIHRSLAVSALALLLVTVTLLLFSREA